MCRSNLETIVYTIKALLMVRLTRRFDLVSHSSTGRRRTLQHATPSFLIPFLDDSTTNRLTLICRRGPVRTAAPQLRRAPRTHGYARSFLVHKLRQCSLYVIYHMIMDNRKSNSRIERKSMRVFNSFHRVVGIVVIFLPQRLADGLALLTVLPHCEMIIMRIEMNLKHILWTY